MVVGYTPRWVHLTAKDALWNNQNLFGWCVRATGTIPIQVGG